MRYQIFLSVNTNIIDEEIHCTTNRNSIEYIKSIRTSFIANFGAILFTSLTIVERFKRNIYLDESSGVIVQSNLARILKTHGTVRGNDKLTHVA